MAGVWSCTQPRCHLSHWKFTCACHSSWNRQKLSFCEIKIWQPSWNGHSPLPRLATHCAGNVNVLAVQTSTRSALSHTSGRAPCRRWSPFATADVLSAMCKPCPGAMANGITKPIALWMLHGGMWGGDGWCWILRNGLPFGSRNARFLWDNKWSYALRQAFAPWLLVEVPAPSRILSWSILVTYGL